MMTECLGARTAKMNPRDLDRTSDLSVTVQLQPNALPAELLGDGSDDQRSSHGDRRGKLGRCGLDAVLVRYAVAVRFGL